MEKLIIISVKELYPGLFQCQYFVPKLHVVINNVSIVTETKKKMMLVTDLSMKGFGNHTIPNYSLDTFVE